jgi:anti-sigma B factor antagonist
LPPNGVAARTPSPPYTGSSRASSRSARRTPTAGRWVTIDLVLERTTESGWGVLAVEGEVDLYTSPQLRDAVNGMIEEGQDRIVLDLTNVGFMDSSGLGVLVTGLKRVRERDGALSLVCPEGSVHKVLAITGLDKVFPIHQSVAEATAV